MEKLHDVMKLQYGGEVKKATKPSKDEALSSLTKGVNDWVRPGGKSVISKTPGLTLRRILHFTHTKIVSVRLLLVGALLTMTIFEW